MASPRIEGKTLVDHVACLQGRHALVLLERDLLIDEHCRKSRPLRLGLRLSLDQASNVSLSATQKIVGTFKVYDVPEGSTYGPYTLTFNVGTEYNGATATVFIEHQGRDANLGTETKTATVSNGYVTISTDGLSLVTIAVDSSTVTGATTDASATSPQTGVDMAGIAVATAACAIAAVGVGVVLRKKLAE